MRRPRRKEALRARHSIEIIDGRTTRAEQRDRVVERSHEAGPRRAATRMCSREKRIPRTAGPCRVRRGLPWRRAEEVELRRNHAGAVDIGERHGKDEAALARIDEGGVREQSSGKT